MKLIISGTDRPGSNSKKVSFIIQKIYATLGEKVEIIDLADLKIIETMQKSRYGESVPTVIQKTLDLINQSEGLIIVCPEYNGSMPGVLKWFIDHFKYPDAFEYRPICFIGLGGMFGGLRAVEHLQQVFGYRNSFIFPDRIFLINIFRNMKEGELTDLVALDLLNKQSAGFQKFCRALQSEKMDAKSLLDLRRPN
jgi:chromate reductase